MKKTKIDWCDCTVNPVVGCTNGCKYCYGERINTRFHIVKNWKCPEFFPERLKDFESKTPKSVFIDSMSDIGTWSDEWLDAVVEAMYRNQQHWYLALTKTGIRPLMDRLWKYTLKYGKAAPLYIGKTITTQEQADALFKNGDITDFLSIEPILEPIDMTEAICTTATVIIGAETGNRKDKVIPQKAWVDDIVRVADKHGIKVFMKGSLRGIMGESFRQDKLAWEKHNERNSKGERL